MLYMRILCFKYEFEVCVNFVRVLGCRIVVLEIDYLSFEFIYFSCVMRNV